MDYKEEVTNQNLIFHLEGNLDMLTSGILKERLLITVADDINNIIFNLDKVGFIDSSGFGLLIHINEKFKKKSGKKLKISNVPRCVQQVFRISKIGEVMDIYESLEDALRTN